MSSLDMLRGLVIVGDGSRSRARLRSMVILAGAQFMGRRVCLAIGAAILLGHNLLDAVWPAAMTSGSTAPLWAALHSRQFYGVGSFAIFFSYPLLPWVCVMLLGYGAAGIFELPAKKREKQLLRIGMVSMTGSDAGTKTGTTSDL